ncbi:MAG: Mur ligase family protein [Sphaerochaetaceae bacterium]
MKRVSALFTNNKLISECTIIGNSDPLVGNISFVASEIDKGGIYIAVVGLNVDGHIFIEQAISNGAVAIIHSNNLEYYDPTITYIKHPNVRLVASHLASNLEKPVVENVIGITGTDGKSTTSQFLWQILNRANHKSALLTSVTYDDGSGAKSSPFAQSTPEAPTLHKFLNSCYKNRVKSVILESTSHALSDEGSRLKDITFNGAIYTTFTNEHMEFHKTLGNYLDAKLNLARQLNENSFVVMPYNFVNKKEVLFVIPSDVKVGFYSLDNYIDDGVLNAKSVEVGFGYRKVQLIDPETKKSYLIEIPYGEDVYTKNLLAAILASKYHLNLSWPEVFEKANKIEKVKGRFETIEFDKRTVVIDFAHTIDSFEKIFNHAKKFLNGGRIIAVFGSAGERDRAKRFPMGRLAANNCDIIYLSDEDPRNEDPHQIIEDLYQGIISTGEKVPTYKILDRKTAIREALLNSKPNDIILLLAKGHEQRILYPDKKIWWDEKEIAMQLIKELGFSYE